MSSYKSGQISEIPPATQLALLRHLLRVAQAEVDSTGSAKTGWVEGDFFQDPLPAYTNVAVDFDLLSCRMPQNRI